MSGGPPAKQPFGWRLQYVLATAVGAATVVILALQLGGGHASPPSGQPPSTPSSSPSPVTPTVTSPGPHPGGGSRPTPSPSAGIAVLGRDLQPVDQTECRSPTLAQGAAWQFEQVELAGHAFPAAYSCDLFRGGVGSLDFILGKAYRQLSLTAGFADTSQSTDQTIRLEIIGDGQYYVSEPKTLRFGDVVDIQANVTGITRLQLKITELSPAGGSGAPSQPSLAGLTVSSK